MILSQNPNQASLHQMANLDFCDTHNMVAFLNKSEGSEGFQQIVDFLNTSHIKFDLAENPTIYTLLIQQFWQTASRSTLKDGEVEITATIDGQLKTITEASLRRHLKLEDADGISSLPNTKIFEQLALMGYASDSDKLTFQKGHFSPQWRFLIHTILHCLSPKKTAWEQFSSNIATAIICLATNRTFNFSKMIFEGMVKNLDSRSKFLMYPRFIQILLNKHQRLLLPHKRTYVAPTLTQKLFSNMRRVSKGGHTPGSDEGRMQQTELMDLVIKLSDKVLALETDLQQTKKVYCAAVTKLIMKGRMIDDIDQDAGITLVTLKGLLIKKVDHHEESVGVLTCALMVTLQMLLEFTLIVEEQEHFKVERKKRKRGYDSSFKFKNNLDQEESQRIVRDAEITLRLQEEIDDAGRQRMAKVHQEAQGFTEDE
ncbi:hypothetical protein Tco_0750157 [Tanacetum coccineum]|uniref:Synaptobrevin, longin-like domain protein n=1 Tax=Tanacetum coccineum TaxID=301880 RepID=A0ABQ4Z1J6_9ASTR